MTGLLIAAVGAALVTAGLFVLFGPWALVVAGGVLIVAGVSIPWEELTHAKPAPSPPRR
jgi:hypothetical protein